MVISRRFRRNRTVTDGKDKAEADRLSWQLWRRLYSDDMSAADESYALPCAVLKVQVDCCMCVQAVSVATSISLQPTQPPGMPQPGWLQALMTSGYVTEDVEDWSKMTHGCAVLMPNTARAGPY